jgi:hypothetical protein
MKRRKTRQGTNSCARARSVTTKSYWKHRYDEQPGERHVANRVTLLSHPHPVLLLLLLPPLQRGAGCQSYSV